MESNEMSYRYYLTNQVDVFMEDEGSKTLVNINSF